METKAKSYCVALTTGAHYPGTVTPIHEHIDLEKAVQFRQKLAFSDRDAHYAIFDEAIGLTEEGLVIDESGRLRK